MPCEEVSLLNRDTTYARANKQYICTKKVRVENLDATVKVYPNLRRAGTLESAVIYNYTPDGAERMIAAGVSSKEAASIESLHTEILSRIVPLLVLIATVLQGTISYLIMCG
jgi:hypothetical protein